MRVLIVDDERNIRESIRRLFELEGIEAAVAESGVQGAALLAAEAFDAAIVDLRMPGMGGQELLEWMRGEGLRTPVIMISAFGEIEDAVRALKSGASDYLIKPFDPSELIHRVRGIVGNRRREDILEAGARTARFEQKLLGDGEAMRELVALVERIAGSDTTVLVTGESGTGKEVVAREIHARSRRAAEPFIAVNIGGIHAELVESELFGHERGAFTGADSRKLGLFELAGEGCLFLDEIGEMPLPLQVKLLRVLQERKIRRLGGSRDIPVGARFISATNRDIEALVAEGRFREDLYYRLNVVRLKVPPLRERREDIPLLAAAILKKVCARGGRAELALSSEALEALGRYSFPGNIRELENLLERAAIYCEGEIIGPEGLDLPQGRQRGAEDQVQLQEAGVGLHERSPAASSGAEGAEGASLEDAEKDAILLALERCGGNRTHAAAALGISRRALLYKIKRHGLS
jgi:two-component system response regulator AtoC